MDAPPLYIFPKEKAEAGLEDNRMAHFHFFREIVNVPAWLVNVYFLNDPYAPSDYEEWQRGLMEVKTALGISGLEVP